MKIAVNTRFLIKNKLEGIGWFTYETLKRITHQHPEHHFYFFFDRKYSEEFLFSKNITPVILFPAARHPLLWYWWFEYSVSRELKKINADLFLSTDGYCSLHAACRQLMVIHDIAFEHFPDHVDGLTSRFYRHFTPKYARRADRIITVSEFTRQDVISHYAIPAEKIDVACNGASASFQPLSKEEKEKVKREFTGGMDYFIYAGAIQPRKNIIRLLQAFDAFKKESDSPIKLVMAGRNWNYTEAEQTCEAMQSKSDVIWPGHLSRNDLTRLMAAATAMVYVSLFEGFGIPIVEAMNCEVPVITSTSSSMPEVAGDAALFVDPTSIEDIAAKMAIMSSSEGVRSELIEKGRIQRQKFTWEKAASQLWESLMKTTRNNI